MYSINEVLKIYESNWDIEKPKDNYNNLYNIFFQECIDIGFWTNDKNNINYKKQLGYGNFMCSLSNDSLPNGSIEGKLLLCRLSVWILFFDDIIDDLFYDIKKSEFLIKRMEDIMLFGNIPNEPSKIEMYGLYVRNSIIKNSKDLHQVNRFLYRCREFFDSLIPTNQIHSLNVQSPFQLSRYLRCINNATHLLFSVFEINNPQWNIDSNFWLNHKLLKIYNLVSYSVSLTNDVYSYEKELKDNNLGVNVFALILKENNNDFGKSFNAVKLQIVDYVNEIKFYQNSLVQELPDHQKEDCQQFLKSFQQLLWGEFQGELNSKRYNNKNSKFIELRE